MRSYMWHLALAGQDSEQCEHIHCELSFETSSKFHISLSKQSLQITLRHVPSPKLEHTTAGVRRASRAQMWQYVDGSLFTCVLGFLLERCLLIPNVGVPGMLPDAAPPLLAVAPFAPAVDSRRVLDMRGVVAPRALLGVPKPKSGAFSATPRALLEPLFAPRGPSPERARSRCPKLAKLASASSPKSDESSSRVPDDIGGSPSLLNSTRGSGTENVR
mmetsp:Transcript_4911/g.13205  ORF Transcript_4911/g.13205 Transcript_4911/m.13205 type:complete len:217 (-) Transcript_4911:1077-1727(-)